MDWTCCFWFRFWSLSPARFLLFCSSVSRFISIPPTQRAPGAASPVLRAPPRRPGRFSRKTPVRQGRGGGAGGGRLSEGHPSPSRMTNSLWVRSLPPRRPSQLIISLALLASFRWPSLPRKTSRGATLTTKPSPERARVRDAGSPDRGGRIFGCFFSFFTGPEFQIISASGPRVGNHLSKSTAGRRPASSAGTSCSDSANWRHRGQSGLALIVICFLEPMSQQPNDGY